MNLFRLFVCAAITLSVASQYALSQVTPPAIKQPRGKIRPQKTIQDEIAVQLAALHEKVQYYQLLGGAPSLTEAVTPPTKQLMLLWDELGASYPAFKGAAFCKKCEYLAILTAVSDADAEKQLQTIAASTVKTDAARGKIGLALAHWWTNWPNHEAQNKSITEINDALAAPDSEQAAAEAIMMIYATNNLTDEQNMTLSKLVMDKLKAPSSANLRAEAQLILNRYALIGKPMTIVGRTSDNKDFTTAKWKGKVVVVDFWATWCPPCREDLPNVIKMYQDFHDKGVELVAVSSDTDIQQLRTFLTSNTAMVWPQLFSSNHLTSGWHPLTGQYFVNSIPTMFVIDKLGVCRAIGNRAKIEAMLPDLLAESDKAKPAH